MPSRPGGDLGWFPHLRSVEALARLQIDARSLVLDFLDIPTPVIAALPGPAVGLGATIALLCDGLIMADTATLADPHVSVGLVAGDGGTAVWPLVLGPARAKQYLLHGGAGRRICCGRHGAGHPGGGSGPAR